MRVFDLYMAFENWEPESTFVLLEYAKEIWKGNWFQLPGCYYKELVETFGVLQDGTIWIEIN